MLRHPILIIPQVLITFFAVAGCNSNTDGTGTQNCLDTDSETDSHTDTDSDTDSDTDTDTEDVCSDMPGGLQEVHLGDSYLWGTVTEDAPRSFVYCAELPHWIRLEVFSSTDMWYEVPVPYMKVLGPDGQLQADMDYYPTGGDIDNSGIGLEVYLSEPGVWTILFEDRNSSDTFHFSIDPLDQSTEEPDSEGQPFVVEDASSLWEVTLVPVGVNLEKEGDVDWILISRPFTAGPIEVWGQAEIPGSDAEIKLTLFDPSDQIVATTADLGADDRITVIGGQPGDYLLKVEDNSGGGGQNYWTVIYVRVHGESFGEPYEFEDEPNDTVTDVELLAYDVWQDGDYFAHDYFYQGNFEQDGDEDWFLFEMFDAESRMIKLIWLSEGWGSSTRPSVQVIDPDGETMIDIGGLNVAFGSEYPFNSHWELHDPPPGIYSMKFASSQGVYEPEATYFFHVTVQNWIDYE